MFWCFLGDIIYWPLTEAKYKAVWTKWSEQLYHFLLLLPVSFGSPEVVVSLILVSEDLKSLPSHFAILTKLLRREHMWVEEMFLCGHGRAGLAASLRTTDFSAVPFFCIAKGRKESFPNLRSCVNRSIGQRRHQRAELAMLIDGEDESGLCSWLHDGLLSSRFISHVLQSGPQKVQPVWDLSAQCFEHSRTNVLGNEHCHEELPAAQQYYLSNVPTSSFPIPSPHWDVRASSGTLLFSEITGAAEHFKKSGSVP